MSSVVHSTPNGISEDESRFQDSMQMSNEEAAEELREQEAQALEDDLTIEGQEPRSFVPRRSYSHSTLGATNNGNQNEDVRLSLLKHGLAMHTSASEVFEHGSTTPTARLTTYSSLPPSPRVDKDFIFGVNGSKQNQADLASARKIFEKGSLPAKLEAENGQGPAKATRSRRGTAHEANGRPTVDLGSPDIDWQENHETASRPHGLAGLWSLMKEEAEAEDWQSWVVEGRWERIANFLAIPLAVERVTLFGALLCLDGFLYNFTILPIRAIVSLSQVIFEWRKARHLWPLSPSQVHCLLRIALLLVPTSILLLVTDTSKMYHHIRGQDTIKLYVIFGVLEIADRLCCAFGQDVLDTLFARDTLSASVGKVTEGARRRRARPAFFFALALAYILLHTLVYFYMLISLNVAINSYDYTLLSLLISNQFVEIKGSVFKKFDKENLFQIMCADIVERFQLSLMLCVVAARNLIEMAGSDLAFLPKSFVRGKSLLNSIMSPVLFVMLSEMLVDWLKHAFITKFNHVRASVYERFIDILAKDVIVARSFRRRSPHTCSGHQPLFVDQSPIVTRRLGFASLPLACLVTCYAAQAFGIFVAPSCLVDETSITQQWLWGVLKWVAGLVLLSCAWGCLIVVKILLGISLLRFATARRQGMEHREAEDAVNDVGRSPIGLSSKEIRYNAETSEYLLKPESDALKEQSNLYRPAESEKKAGEKQGPEKYQSSSSDKKKWRLEEIDRWTMVKRIW